VSMRRGVSSLLEATTGAGIISDMRERMLKR